MSLRLPIYQAVRDVIPTKISIQAMGNYENFASSKIMLIFTKHTPKPEKKLKQ